MKKAFLVASAALSTLQGCGDGGRQESPKAETAPDAKPGLSVSDGALVLPAVAGRPGAAYFTLVNAGGKETALAAASVEGAEKAEMHETQGGTMRPLTSLPLKSGETARFERGGKHVMVFGLPAQLSAGSSVEMTLTFADGDKLSTPLKVTAAGGGQDGHADHKEN